MNRMQQMRDNVWYDRLYKLTVITKGLDGLAGLTGRIGAYTGAWVFASCFTVAFG